MIRYISIERILLIYRYVIEQSGGTSGLRDRGLLEAALAQPQMTYGGVDLYDSLVDKAAALGFSLIQNHPFVDGNKRIGHAAMAVFLAINGYAIQATVDEQEELILAVASSRMSRSELADWLATHIVQRQQ
jgi:death on curing protein